MKQSDFKLDFIAGYIIVYPAKDYRSPIEETSGKIYSCLEYVMEMMLLRIYRLIMCLANLTDKI